jgi:hypothetical protein
MQQPRHLLKHYLHNIEKLSTVSSADVVISAELTLLVIKTYGVLFSTDIKTCANSIKDYHKRIIQDGLKVLLIMEQQKKYKLKEGVVIYSAKYKQHFSVRNMTDEVAEKLINDNPNLKNQFIIDESEPLPAKAPKRGKRK